VTRSGSIGRLLLYFGAKYGSTAANVFSTAIDVPKGGIDKCASHSGRFAPLPDFTVAT